MRNPGLEIYVLPAQGKNFSLTHRCLKGDLKYRYHLPRLPLGTVPDNQSFLSGSYSTITSGRELRFAYIGYWVVVANIPLNRRNTMNKSFSSIPDAVEAIKMCKVVIVLDDEARENEGDLIFAAEKITSSPFISSMP